MSIVRVLQSVESKIIDEKSEGGVAVSRTRVYEARAALRSVNVGTDLDG